MDENKETINFSQVLSALADVETPFPPRLLRGFSDLTRRNIKELLTIWKTLPESRKVGILEDLDDLLEKDTLVNFDELVKIVITDTSAKVRVSALNLLWECEEPRIVPLLINLLDNDTDEAVRASSASLLGRFVLLGELDAISVKLRDEIVNRLIDINRINELPRVKQRALESLGYSSHPDVPELIRNSYNYNDIPWVTSALCAMGRSADEQWASIIQENLNSQDVEVQFEAVRAAGELELSTAREPLLALLDEEIEDTETRLAVIWALSQIGGDEVKEKLDEMLASAIDEDEIDWIEKALENLELSGTGSMEMLDFTPEEDAEFDFDEETDADLAETRGNDFEDQYDDR